MEERERLIRDKSASAELLRWGKRYNDTFIQATVLARMKPTSARWDEIVALIEDFSEEALDTLDLELEAWPDKFRTLSWRRTKSLSYGDDPKIKLIRSLDDADFESLEKLQTFFSSRHLNLHDPFSWTCCYLSAFASLNSQGMLGHRFIFEKISDAACKAGGE